MVRALRLPALLPAVAVVVALAAAGCGSSSDDTTSSATGTAAAGGTGAGTGTVTAAAGKQASGAPLTIANFSDNAPANKLVLASFLAGEQAGIAYVNEELGGIKGRPLKLKDCDTKYDAAATTACATAAVGLNPIMTMGLATFYGPNASATFRDKKVPSQVIPQSKQDYANAGGFPVGAGSFSEFKCQAWYVGKTFKPKTVALLEPDIPSSPEVINQLKANLATAAPGVKITNVVLYPFTGADLTSSIVKAVKGKPDFLLIATGAGPLAVQIYKTIVAQGFPIDHTINIMATIDKGAFFDHLGTAANNGYFTSEFTNYFDDSDPQVKLFQDKMKQYQSGAGAQSGWAEWGFSNIMQLHEVGNTLSGEVTPEALYDKLSAASAIPGFLTPGQASPVPGAPGIRQSACQILQWDGSRLKNAVPGWFQPPTTSN